MVEGYVPMVIFAIVGVGIIFLLLRFKRRNDLSLWMKKLRSGADRAAADEEFRKAELQAVEAEIAKYDPPRPIEAVKRRQEFFILSLPKVLFITGAGAVVLTFIGWFHPSGRESSDVLRYGGPILLAVTLLVILATGRMRAHYAYLQQLNRKYLMQKAGKDEEGLLATLGLILQYYPGVANLWLEKSDQLSQFGRLVEAVEAVGKAREIEPGNVDFAVVELSFLLRSGELELAAVKLDELEGMKTAPTDPRVEIYRAQLALLRNERKKALVHATRASELDAVFTTKFLDRETSLVDLRRMMQESKLIF